MTCDPRRDAYPKLMMLMSCSHERYQGTALRWYRTPEKTTMGVRSAGAAGKKP